MARAALVPVYTEVPSMGLDGRGVLSGSRAPLMTDGRVGDFWLDTIAKKLYGPKSAAGWPDRGLIRGAAGWYPLERIVADGVRRVVEIYDWAGGEGIKPATGFKTADGEVTATIADAVNLRGGEGPQALINALDAASSDLGYDSLVATGEANSDNVKRTIGAIFEPGGAMPFANVASASAGAIPKRVKALDLYGATTAGIGAHRRRRVNAEPSHAGKHRSTDRFTADGGTDSANGGWWEIAEPVVTPEMVGGSVQTAANVAKAIGAILQLTGGKTYSIGRLIIPDGLKLRAQGAILRADGTTTGSEFALTVGNAVDFDQLFVSTPGTETALDVISVGDGVTGNMMCLTSDIARIGGGITSRGQDVKIGLIVAKNIDRPLHLYNQSATPTTGCDIGFLEAVGYIRGLRADNVTGRIGGVRFTQRSPNAVLMTPGQNGILLQGCNGLEIGDCWIEDSSEHAIRVGGSNAGTKSKVLKIGKVTTIRATGCAIKLNPTLLSGPGVTETVDNVQIANVMAIDTGNGDLGGNKETLRLSHVRNIQIGEVLAVVDGQTVSGQYGLQINDARNVQIASLGGAFNAGAVIIDGTSDITPGEQFGGDVIGLRIGRLHGTSPGNNGMAVNTTFNVSDVHIHFDGLSGFTTNLCRWIAGNLTGVFRLTGWVGGSVAPAYQGAPASDNFQVDVTWNNQRAIGRAALVRGTAGMEVVPPPFSAASQAPTGAMISSARATAGAGNYGAGVEFTRLGSSRRAAAIVPRQGSADDKEVGLDFYTGDTNSTANEALTLALRLSHLQRVELPATLTKYADNAAALAAGLPVGTLYWTNTGEARVVV